MTFPAYVIMIMMLRNRRKVSTNTNDERTLAHLPADILDIIVKMMYYSISDFVGDLINLNPNIPEKEIKWRIQKKEKGYEIIFPHSNLQKIPPDICRLEEIATLDLSGNKLRKLPDRFGHLKIKGDLNLSATQLISLPDSFKYIIVEGVLNLKHNYLSVTPVIDSPPGKLLIEGNEIKEEIKTTNHPETTCFILYFEDFPVLE